MRARENGGERAEDDAGAQRGQQSEGEHAAVNPNFVGARRKACGKIGQEPQAAVREEPSQSASNKRDQKTFGEKLAQETASRSAQGRANGELALPAGHPGESQVCNVGASDAPHESRRGQEHQQSRPGLASEFVLKRASPGGLPERV